MVLTMVAFSVLMTRRLRVHLHRLLYRCQRHTQIDASLLARIERNLVQFGGRKPRLGYAEKRVSACRHIEQLVLPAAVCGRSADTIVVQVGERDHRASDDAAGLILNSADKRSERGLREGRCTGEQDQTNNQQVTSSKQA
jgi:hypothetical protein